jgi:hypothetical protein
MDEKAMCRARANEDMTVSTTSRLLSQLTGSRGAFQAFSSSGEMSSIFGGYIAVTRTF